MIPKNLFFIWFGNEEPDYVKFAINTFEEVNPNFKINFLRYTVSQIENKEKVSKFDKDVYKCLDYIANKKYKNNKYTCYIKYYKRKKRRSLQILSNITRRMLLDKYGGIFLDCDMFPVNPFDDELLSNDYFKMKRIHNQKEYIEGGFCRCCRNSKLTEPKIIGCIRDTELLTKELQNKFYNCTLKYGEHYSTEEDQNYVEHYGTSRWNPSRYIVNKTKMDLEIEEKLHLNINFMVDNETFYKNVIDKYSIKI